MTDEQLTNVIENLRTFSEYDEVLLISKKYLYEGSISLRQFVDITNLMYSPEKKFTVENGLINIIEDGN